MKTRKHLLSIIFLSSLMSLSACSLFNDDDVKYSNQYNPKISQVSEDPNAVKAGGVTGKVVDKVPNALCFKNINYATNNKIVNTYKSGGANHKEYNVNNNQDYTADKTSNNFDLYVPNGLNKADKHVVVLFIHGGAWVSGLKIDVNPYVHEFANKGYITATIKYTLLKRTMDDSTLSIFRNLDEIDACLSKIKSCLGELGFDTTKSNLVLGGASSGAHLAMLYSYSRGKSSPIPLKFIVDAVGPVDIKPDSWKSFVNANDSALDGGLSASAIATQKTNGNITELTIMGEEGSPTWNEYQTMRIANGMCGLPYSKSEVEASTDSNKRAITNPNAASNSMTKAGGGEDQLSVTYWMSSTNNFPIVCAYAGKDSIVGIGQYARLETALNANSIQHEMFYFRDSDHTEISKEKNETAYTNFINKIDEWCRAI